MKNTFIMTTLGMAGGVAAGILLARHMPGAASQKWRNRIESKLIDTDIRLDILEYDHLHEDDYLKIMFEDSLD